MLIGRPVFSYTLFGLLVATVLASLVSLVSLVTSEVGVSSLE